jgi:hypothetical protein
VQIAWEDVVRVTDADPPVDWEAFIEKLRMHKKLYGEVLYIDPKEEVVVVAQDCADAHGNGDAKLDFHIVPLVTVKRVIRLGALA